MMKRVMYCGILDMDLMTNRSKKLRMIRRKTTRRRKISKKVYTKQMIVMKKRRNTIGMKLFQVNTIPMKRSTLKRNTKI